MLLHADSEDCSDWAVVNSYLNLFLAQRSFCWPFVMLRHISTTTNTDVIDISNSIKAQRMFLSKISLQMEGNVIEIFKNITSFLRGMIFN